MNATALKTAAVGKPRPYKRFVTSAFHTRFVRAALLLLFICWDIAILLCPKWDILWSWLPLGPAGLRAILYFFSAIFVFILQVDTISVGRPTPTSPFQRARRSLLSASSVKTVIWYLVSAFWFTEVYIWLSSDMTWVDRHRGSSPATLNERPIYFRAFFLTLGFVQAVKHIYFGLATLQLPIAAAPIPQDKISSTHALPDTFTVLKSQAKNMILRSLAGSVATAIVCPFLYTALLRHFMWQIHLRIAKLMFTIARSNSKPSGIPPIFGTMPTTIWIGFLLSGMWELSSICLIAYFKKAPIKDGKPWTSSGKDPNGSLLTGLKAKRGIVKTYAFWELAIIAQNYPERRRLIFSDIDRPTGPIWSQMLAEALKVLQQMDERIQPPQPTNAASKEPAPSLPKILKPQRENTKAEEERNLLAQRAAKDARARQRLLDIANEKLKQLGSHPDPVAVPTIPDTSTLVENAKAYSSWFFSSSAASRINAIILGSPSSDAATVVDATEAITRMLIASLQDDAYGKAMAGVPQAVKQFTRSIGLIEGVLHQQQVTGDVREVDIVLGRLKSGLSELLSGFQMFLSDSGLGIADLNAAKKASGQLAAEEEEQKRLQAAPSQQKELLEFRDVEEPADNPAPTEPWREWNKPKKQPTKLFPQYEGNTRPRRQVSNGSSRRANGTVQRAREMEQVR